MIMKKLIFTLLFLSTVVALKAQTYNLFDAADVDENGWIWFDTQAKIDKYIGQADNDNYTVDPNGKLIQMVGADFGDYEDSSVSATVVGAGTDAEIGGPGAKTGAILTAPSSASMQTNGGGIVLRLPSLSSLSLFLSSENTVYVRLLGSTDIDLSFSDYTIVSAKYSSVFGPLFRGGQKEWTGMETLDSNNEPYFKLASDGPIYAYLQSLTKTPIMIHGMKVMTSTPTSGVEDVVGAQTMISFEAGQLSLSQDATAIVFDLTGQQVFATSASSTNLSTLNKGIYVVKAQSGTKTQMKKIVVQ